MGLALQGGGSHGAFTWGVLDRLLEARINVLGVSGASAGALNGAALVAGLASGGHAGARASLEALWLGVARQALQDPLQSTPLDYLLHGWNRDTSPTFQLVKNLTRVASPYQLNPAGYNPLTELLESVIDFDALRHPSAVPLFVALTSVRSGRLVLRRNATVCARSLVASACLPFLFQAVQLDGEYYWDGGYTANPALFPLLLECPATDLLVVQLTVDDHPELPTSAAAILERANEIAFHSSLVRELQILAGLRRSGHLRGLQSVAVHRITADEDLAGVGNTSRINADRDFLLHLRDLGRRRANAWLAERGRGAGGLRLEDYLA